MIITCTMDLQAACIMEDEIGVKLHDNRTRTAYEDMWPTWLGTFIMQPPSGIGSRQMVVKIPFVVAPPTPHVLPSASDVCATVRQQRFLLIAQQPQLQTHVHPHPLNTHRFKEIPHPSYTSYVAHGFLLKHILNFSSGIVPGSPGNLKIAKILNWPKRAMNTQNSV